MDNAAITMRYEILKAFATGGPGWKPLSAMTMQKKIKSGSPNPTKILREFNVMRNSITIKDESSTRAVPIKGKSIGTTFSNRPGAGESGKYSQLRPTVGFRTEINHVRSIGLFKDRALKYDRYMAGGFRQGMFSFKKKYHEWQALDVVSRGFKHEFGGFEFQVKEEKGQDEMEIRTGGLEKKALKGEGVVAEDKHLKAGMKSKKSISSTTTRSGKTRVKQAIAKVRQVLQKVTKGKKTTEHQIVYIPERSFLRMPFDRAVPHLMNNIVAIMRRRIDSMW